MEGELLSTAIANSPSMTQFGIDASKLAQPSLLDSLAGMGTQALDFGKDAGKFLASDQGSNLLKFGTDAYGLYNNQKLMNKQLGLMKAQEGRAEDAYQRDVESSNRRKALRF